MIKLPPPDCQYGYYSATLKKLFGPTIWLKFCHWHAGQTGMVGEHGERIVYTHDVQQFLAGGKDLEFSDPVSEAPRPWEL